MLPSPETINHTQDFPVHLRKHNKKTYTLSIPVSALGESLGRKNFYMRGRVVDKQILLRVEEERQ